MFGRGRSHPVNRSRISFIPPRKHPGKFSTCAATGEIFRPSSTLVWRETRPTNQQSRFKTIPLLTSLYFYSFRQEYRLERKLLNELSADPETLSLDEKDLAALVSPATTTSPQAYRISRVVVLHDNKLETFVDENADDVDDFFDNDSFWSGSITWY